jgi:hypothetical protein
VRTKDKIDYLRRRVEVLQQQCDALIDIVEEMQRLMVLHLHSTTYHPSIKKAGDK